MAYYNDESTSKSMKNHTGSSFKYMEKIALILLPLSVFSLLLSHSSLASLLAQSYDYLVSNFAFKLKLFTCTTERNCIFLLCNGILVVIIQSSGLISKITPVKSTIIDYLHKDDEKARFEETKKMGVEEVEILEEKSLGNGSDLTAEVEEIFQSCEDEKWEEEEKEEEEEEEAEEEEEEAEEEAEAEAEEEEDEEEEGMGNEELKKKFEDFIKKTKQEIQSP